MSRNRYVVCMQSPYSRWPAPAIKSGKLSPPLTINTTPKSPFVRRGMMARSSMYWLVPRHCWIRRMICASTRVGPLSAA